MIKKKICMLGSFAVGKTSLVQRFVRSVFSEKYLTTVGVKIDQKTVNVDGEDILLILWDIHGEDDFEKVRASYLAGMSGCFLVADGTRAFTLDVALKLGRLAESTVGDVPRVLLVNKVDLMPQWEITRETISALEAQGFRIVLTSAMSGAAVEDAFVALTKAMMASGGVKS